MLKIIGCFFILGASIGLAYQIQKELKQHQNRLREVLNLFTEIFWEMTYSMKPVEMVLLYQIQTKDECLLGILREIGERLMKKQARNGAEVWTEVFEERKEVLSLKEEEIELIQEAGRAFFGKSMEENQKVLAIYQERLHFLIEMEQKEHKEKRKVSQTVCIMCGLMLIILLI